MVRKPKVGDEAILIYGVIQCELGCRVVVLGTMGSDWMVQIISKKDYAFRVVPETSLQLLPKSALTSWPPDPTRLD